MTALNRSNKVDQMPNSGMSGVLVWLSQKLMLKITSPKDSLLLC